MWREPEGLHGNDLDPVRGMDLHYNSVHRVQIQSSRTIRRALSHAPRACPCGCIRACQSVSIGGLSRRTLRTGEGG